jgi:hypothetical protein
MFGVLKRTTASVGAAIMFGLSFIVTKKDPGGAGVRVAE